jgi:hypothetical protein
MRLYKLRKTTENLNEDSARDGNQLHKTEQLALRYTNVLGSSRGAYLKAT